MPVRVRGILLVGVILALVPLTFAQSDSDVAFDAVSVKPPYVGMPPGFQAPTGLLRGGLKLDPQTVPTDVIVIDHIERPTPD